jgi:hypothetical protein
VSSSETASLNNYACLTQFSNLYDTIPDADRPYIKDVFMGSTNKGNVSDIRDTLRKDFVGVFNQPTGQPDNQATEAK